MAIPKRPARRVTKATPPSAGAPSTLQRFTSPGTTGAFKSAKSVRTTGNPDMKPGRTSR